MRVCEHVFYFSFRVVIVFLRITVMALRTLHFCLLFHEKSVKVELLLNSRSRHLCVQMLSFIGESTKLLFYRVSHFKKVLHYESFIALMLLTSFYLFV